MRALALVSSLCFLGCESVEDVVTKQRPLVEKTFASLATLDAKVKSAEPIDAVKMKTAPIVLEGANANAMFIYAEDLAKPFDAPAEVPLRTIDSIPLLQCTSLLTTKHLFKDSVARVSPSIATGYLGACAQLRYALVIRTREYLRPELQLETKQFASGKWRADVYVFDVTTGEALGGYPVTALNDSRVSLLDGDKDHVRRLIANLESTVFDALRAGAKNAIPGALP